MAADTYRRFTSLIYTILSPFPSRKISELCIFLTGGIADFLAHLQQIPAKQGIRGPIVFPGQTALRI
jgi:hypothetical protein